MVDRAAEEAVPPRCGCFRARRQAVAREKAGIAPLPEEGEGGEGEAVEGTEAGATETTPAGEPAAGEESMTEAPAATETMPEPTGEGM